MVIVFIISGVVIALALFALLAKTYAGKPKRVKPGEKGEILKQLLALAESENCVSASGSPPARSLRLVPPSNKHTEPVQSLTYSAMRPSSPKPIEADAAADDIEAQISRRAYELYQERGGIDGNAAADWQQARDEVLGRRTKSATTSSQARQLPGGKPGRNPIK